MSAYIGYIPILYTTAFLKAYHNILKLTRRGRLCRFLALYADRIAERIGRADTRYQLVLAVGAFDAHTLRYSRPIGDEISPNASSLTSDGADAQ